MKRKVVIYTRVSTVGQGEKKNSLIDQKALLIKHCESKRWEIIAHFEDKFSAKSFERPRFKEFLAQVKQKQIKPDILLCVRHDRFSRDAFESLKMVQFLRDNKIEYRTIENDFDLSIPENYIPYILNLTLPQVENERRALNTKTGMRRAKLQGKWVASAPKGYDNVQENGVKIIRPNDDSKYIAEAFRLIEKGVYTISEVKENLLKRVLKSLNRKFIIS